MANPGYGSPQLTNDSSWPGGSAGSTLSVTTEQVSDMPQPGCITCPGSPNGRSTCRKRRAAEATTTSPAFITSLIGDRSHVRPPKRCACSAKSPKAKFGAQVTLTRCRSARSAQRSGSCRTHEVGAWI